jgi:hypothetical protein
METKKIMATFAVLMVALMGVGYAYAHWTDTLLINGTINTGSINVKYTSVTCSDTGTDPDYTKDVGSCTTGISDDGKTFTFTINNAYPSYHFLVTIVIKNFGTVPVYPKSFTYQTSGNPQGADPVESWLTVTPQIGWPVGQIDGGQSTTIVLYVHFEENTPQSATVTITGSLTFWNWNEVQPP